MKLEHFLESKLESLDKAHRLRTLTVHKPIDAVIRAVDGKEIIQFSSNDYLGLAFDERIIEACCKAAREYGIGSTGSRLITGTTDLHIELEQAIADFKGTEAALFFNSGYSANVGAISSLLSKADVIYSDALNHSSILSGAKLSGAQIVEYEHLLIEDAKNKIRATRNDHRHALIISESVFSMDGDVADLKALAELAEDLDCWLMIDEAHSAGIYNEDGGGLVKQLGLNDKVHIQMGTCSKAIGLQGAYIAGSRQLIDFLTQRARTFIYSTASSPVIAASIIESLKIIKKENWRRDKLFENAHSIRRICKEMGFSVIPGNSQIICLEAPSNEIALSWSQKLFERNLWVQAIRPPTVRTPRLRISCCALHEEKHLNELFEALQTFKTLNLENF